MPKDNTPSPARETPAEEEEGEDDLNSFEV